MADSCLAFAANTHGFQAVSLETAITHLAPCFEGDVLIAEATEENHTKRIVIYTIRVFNDTKQKKVALFKGIQFKTDKEWEV